jgi:hypothetical protein
MSNDDALTQLGKAFPIGPKLNTGARALPVDALTGRVTRVVILRAGVPGMSTPWAITGKTVRKVKYLRAYWMDTNNEATFKTRRDAAEFLDAHRYAQGYRRITGELPAWSAERA